MIKKKDEKSFFAVIETDVDGVYAARTHTNAGAFFFLFPYPRRILICFIGYFINYGTLGQIQRSVSTKIHRFGTFQ